MTRSSGRPGQFHQRLLEQHDIAAQQRTQDQAGGELAALAQVLRQFGDLVVRRFGDERERRFFERLAGR